MCAGQLQLVFLHQCILQPIVRLLVSEPLRSCDSMLHDPQNCIIYSVCLFVNVPFCAKRGQWCVLREASIVCRSASTYSTKQQSALRCCNGGQNSNLQCTECKLNLLQFRQHMKPITCIGTTQPTCRENVATSQRWCECNKKHVLV
jgi:hypothetical protein